MSILKFEDVSVAYEGKLVFSHLSLSVEEGDFVCIVGQNGAGKSTLLKTAAGLISPTKGRVTLAPSLSRRQIGYLPQQLAAKRDFPASVWEVVLSGCISRRGLRPLYTREDKALALKQLAALNALELKNKSFHHLSGGQQQRVLLARALCAAEKVLFLDEPVSGLDPLVTRELYALIKNLHEERGLTILMVSHDLTGAVACAGKILHLEDGVKFYGSVEDYRASEIGQRYLGGLEK